MKRILPAVVFALSSAVPVATIPAPSYAAEQQAPTNVRGSVISYAGSTLKLKTREGETIDVALADDWKLAGVASAKVTDIKPGDFVGIASLPEAGGGDGAL